MHRCAVHYNTEHTVHRIVVPVYYTYTSTSSPAIITCSPVSLMAITGGNIALQPQAEDTNHTVHEGNFVHSVNDTC